MANENKISIHSSAISNKDKTQLIEIYKEYINLVDELSYILQTTSPQKIAFMMDNILSKLEAGRWNIFQDITNEEKDEYEKFINLSPSDENYGKYAFIDTQSPLSDDNRNSIYALPKKYHGQAFSNSLPHPIEKITIAYPIGAIADKINYNVNGKYIMQYEPLTEDQPLESLLHRDRGFMESLSVALAVVELMPLDNQDVQVAQKCKTEAQISEFMQVSENVIISILANLTEKQDRLIKQILYYRDPTNYLSNAEKQDLIPSSEYFQDLLNLRHLLHHQFDTLNGYGRFMNGDNAQNESIRKRNLESYRRLIKGTFAQRVSSYKTHAETFKHFISAICPNVFFKDKEESNNKFIQRIKKYVNQNSNQKIYVELNIKQQAKKASLAKAVQRISPSIEIIDDNQEKDLSNFFDKIKLYEKRQSFLKTFQLVEIRISEHCLECGDNCPAQQGWIKLAKQKILNNEDIDIWNKLKSLRNELSHTCLTNELFEQMEQMRPLFTTKAKELVQKLDDIRPDIISQTKDNTITLKHKDGKIVVIDVKNKQVISITNPRGKDITSQNHQHKSKGCYTEHQEKVKLTLKGTEISSLELDNGFVVNVGKKRIVLPDDSKIFLEEKERNYITTPMAKLITDKAFKVISYIRNKKFISFSKNETMIFPNGYKIDIDNNLRIKNVRFSIKDNTYKISISSKNNQTQITLPNNTIVKIENQKMTIYHNDIELNYDNRKSFIESYNSLPPVIKNKER
ncbi:MAG: hypothetical protein IKW58_02220 [Alphaproteobacteria bacterium]|nr:hypothetical protein [Alphaproteobacteria bacterium]